MEGLGLMTHGPDPKRRRLGDGMPEASQGATPGVAATHQESMNVGAKAEGLAGQHTSPPSGDFKSAGNGSPALLLVPAYAGWLRWDKIHPLERRELPEFFPSSDRPDPTSGAGRREGEASNKGSPELYLEYRNSIINLFRSRPSTPLTFTQVRRCLVGDVMALRRVFNFLARWGIINSQLQDLTSSNPHAAAAPAAPSVVPVSKGFQLEQAVALVVPACPEKGAGGSTPGRKTVGATEEHTRAIVAAEAAVASALKSGQAVDVARASEHAGAGRQLPELPAEVLCNICSKTCLECFYAATRKDDCHMCSSCFAGGRFPPGLEELDFALVTTARRLGGAPEGLAPEQEEQEGSEDGAQHWSDEELLLLLEGVEKFQENWAQVASYVGTKTALQCVLKFIRLPIADSLLEEQRLHSLHLAGGGVLGEQVKQQGHTAGGEDGIPASAEKVEGHATAEAEECVAAPSEVASLVVPAGGILGGGDALVGGGVLPFQDSGNPMLAQLSFMSGVLGTRVASVAAQAAMAALACEDPAVLEELQGIAEGAEEKSFKPPAKDGAAAANESDWLALRTQAACAAAFAAGAVKARLLAEDEEHHIRTLLTKAVESQLKKVGHKLAQYYKIEKLFEAELTDLNSQRQQLLADRIRVAAKEKALLQPK